LYGSASEESVIFDAFFPEVFALVATLEEELHGILVISLKQYNNYYYGKRSKVTAYISLWMQFDQESLALERNLAYLSPREGVDPRDVLEDCDAHVGHSQIKRHPFHILRRMHFHAIQLTPPSRLQEVKVRLRRGLTTG